jgi:hypothetical protein
MKTPREVLNLEHLTWPGNLAFAGRQDGERARRNANLDEKDRDEHEYVVEIPEGASAFTPSFFLGMFDESITTLKEEGFRRKYKFRWEPFTRVINNGIADALVQSTVAAP